MKNSNLFFLSLTIIRGMPNKSNGLVSPGLGTELATPIVTHLFSNIFFRSIFCKAH